MRRKCLAVALVFIAGCAGAKASTPEITAAPIGSGRPSQIVVFPFATSTANVTLNQGIGARIYRKVENENQEEEEGSLAKQTAQNICVQIATSLAGNGWSAACQPRGTQVSAANTLIVDGEFTEISEGNRLRRMVIGLGAGASKLDTAVTLTQFNNGNSAQLLTFTTHADSGKMPGVAVTGPAGAAAGGAAAAATLGANVAMAGAKNVTSAIGFLVKKTAQQVVDQINQYTSQQGWTPAANS